MHHFCNRNFQALSLALAALLVCTPSASAQLPVASPDQIELRIVSGSGAEFQPGSQQKQRLVMQVVNQDERPQAGVAVTFQLPDDGPSGLFSNGQRSIVAFTNEEGEVSISGVKWNDTSGPVSIRVTAVKGMAHAGTLLPVRLTAGSGKHPGADRISQSESPKRGQGPASAAVAAVGQAQAAQPAAQPPHTAIAPSVEIQPGTLPAQSASAAPRQGSERPAVSISGASQGQSGPSNKKWLVIAVVAAAAAAGVTMVLLKKSGSSSSSSTSNNNPLSIGSPTVSVGQP